MKLIGYDIVDQTYIGEDRKVYTLSDLARLGIVNPLSHMLPIGKQKGHAKPARDVNHNIAGKR